MMKKDSIYKNKSKTQPFSFDEEVASVFDDMIQRSIPKYDELQSLITDLVGQFALSDSFIVDYGCSTGTTLKLLQKVPHKRLLGIDNSKPMLDKAAEKLPNIEFEHWDLNTPYPLKNATVAILNLVLQFVRPKNRANQLRAVYEGLNPSGAIILVEKIRVTNPRLSPILNSVYHQFKQNNGYSKQEILNKDLALNDVLIPNSTETNLELLHSAGFTDVEPFYHWANFAGWVGIK